MAQLYLDSGEVSIDACGIDVMRGDVECQVDAGIDDGKLCLSISAVKDKSYELSTIYISGVADIDALKRYCEMALEQFAKGILK